jgi:hypothetical protein
MSELKTKADYAKALDALGVDYPKIESGANAGTPTQTKEELVKLYAEASKLNKEKPGKPVFHRPRINLGNYGRR